MFHQKTCSECKLESECEKREVAVLGLSLEHYAVNGSGGEVPIEAKLSLYHL